MVLAPFALVARRHCSSSRIPLVYIQTLLTSRKSEAQSLADRLGCRLLRESESPTSLDSFPQGTEEYYVLQFGDQVQVTHFLNSGKRFKEKSTLSCDWDDGTLQNRVQQASTKTPLVKAMGVLAKDLDDPQKLPRVLDTTGGLGEDAFFMARFASKVTIVERSPLLHSLLEDGLARAQESLNYLTRSQAEKIDLCAEPMDSCQVLKQLQEQHPSSRPDVIYLDPMHEEKYGKSALPKFKIQLARKLIGRGDLREHDELLEQALLTTRNRVVFKKPMGATKDSKCKFSVSGGRAVRYDVYVVQ